MAEAEQKLSTDESPEKTQDATKLSTNPTLSKNKQKKLRRLEMKMESRMEKRYDLQIVEAYPLAESASLDTSILPITLLPCIGNSSSTRHSK